ncbi:MAG: tubulin-like doman-containing protein [Bacteroidales bacterium]
MPSILIGLGGVGTGVVRRVKKALVENSYYNELVSQEKVIFCSLDIDPNYDSDIGQEVDAVLDFETREPMKVVKANIKDPEFLSWWIPKHAIYAPIAGKSGAGQIRINGRLAFFDNFAKIKSFLSSQIDRARNVSIDMRRKGGSEENCRVRIFVISSLVGGTGAGILVDTVHLLRSLTDETTRIYGVLLDGSIFERLVKGDPNIVSFATLTEIEHWMEDPQKFIMKYGRETVNNDKSKFFDIAFIIQAKNMKGQCFYATPEEVKKNYQTMAALFLESMVTIEDYESFFETNDWNTFDNIRKTNGGRSCCYSSFAVSQISFPVDKVTDYCYARLISERLKDGFDIQKPDFDSMQKDIGICEHNGNQLTNLLRKLPSATILQQKAESVRRTFQEQDVNSKEKFSSLYSEFGLDSLSEWDELIKKYRSEVEKELEEIGAKVKEEVKTEVKNMIGSFKFGEIKNILNEFKGAMIDNKRHASEDKKLWSSKDKHRNQLKMAYDAVVKCKTGLLGIGSEFSKKKQDFLNEFNLWFKSELESAEHKFMSDFYDSLNSHIDALCWVVEYLGGIFSDYVSQCAQDKGKYVDKDWIMSPERSGAQEYLLNMEISTTVKEIEQNIYKDILKIINETTRRLLEEGKEDGFRGLKAIFDELSTSYINNPDKMSANLRSDAQIRRIARDFESMFEQSIKRLIREKVQNIGITDALDWFLQKTYDEIKGCKDSSAKENLKIRLKKIFGDDVDPLFKRTQNLDDWSDIATKALLSHVASLTKPFVEVNDAEVKNIWKDTLDTAGRMEVSLLFVPQNFRRRNTIVELSPTETHFNDKFLFIFQYNFYPLHTLEIFQTVQQEYNKYILECESRISSNKELGGRPIHADVRFYTEWKDNIMITVSDAKPREKEANLLFLLGLGFGVIKRDKAIFSIYNSEDKVHARVKGVDGLYQALKNQDSELRGLAEIIYKKFLEIYQRPNKLELIINVYKNAYEQLKKMSVPKPREGMQPHPSYLVWQDLLKLSEVDAANQARGSLVPRSESQIEELQRELNEMKKTW